MYSFMGGGLFCAFVANILLVVSTATDYWMQYRLSGSYAHQGLWRYCMANKCYMQTASIGEKHEHQWVAKKYGYPLLNFVTPVTPFASRWRTMLLDHSKDCFVRVCPAYWNATRAFMILSAMSCFGGIMAGILSFAQFSVFERFNRSFAAGIMFFISTFFVMVAMAIYTGVTLSFLGKRFGDWRFSWSYILGWVAMLMTFFAGIFYMCAHRMYESRRVVGPR
ncbi:lens intrinsic membrane protein 2.4 [Salminus brasiliensis]|uniref:lens intrinsic membrane protein 2.4 n=1 Tax=Salminus brasiliensis TaxID=930266 RepID=UPI003B8357D2